MTPFNGRPIHDASLAGMPVDGDGPPDLSNPGSRILFQKFGTPLRAFNFISFQFSDDSSARAAAVVAEFGNGIDITWNVGLGTGISGGGGGGGYVVQGVIAAHPPGQSMIVGEILTDAYVRLQGTENEPPPSVNPLTQANYPGYFADRDFAWEEPAEETKFLLIANRLDAPPPDFEPFFTPPNQPAYGEMNGEADLVFGDFVSFAAGQPLIFGVQQGGVPSTEFLRTFFGIP